MLSALTEKGVRIDKATFPSVHDGKYRQKSSQEALNLVYRNTNPAPIAMPAPMSVLKKLITSLVIHSRPFLPCRVAPNRLSTFVAKKAATTEIAIALGPLIKPMAAPNNVTAMPPTTEAAVPSADIAPSVPGSTRARVVIRKVFFPYALPISDANVSDNFVAREATKPRINSSLEIPQRESP